VRASRTRIVEAADEARRRLERDLHDGAQQRFVPAALMLQIAKRRLGGASAEVAELLDRVAGDLDAGLADLRELAHGIHPAVLTDRGLPAALESLAGTRRGVALAHRALAIRARDLRRPAHGVISPEGAGAGTRERHRVTR